MNDLRLERVLRMIGQRIRFARETKGWNQALLAEKLGFKDRQILSNLEAGKRRLAADELMKLTDLFELPMDFFTDSFRLVGEGEFSWRARGASPAAKESFAERARQVVVTYWRLSELRGEPHMIHSLALKLTQRSSWEEARLAGEQLALAWNLGEFPAQRLSEVVEQQHGLLVLHMDPPEGISGAACRLPELNTVFINRREPDGRRSFNLAHELFHILTWQEMPPREWDDETAEMTPRERRVEQLADNFAGALLMPATTLRKLWENRGSKDIHAWLNNTASGLSVTALALKTRLEQAELLTAENDLLKIDPARLTWNGRTPGERSLPKLYSRRFVELLHWALDKGELSVRRAAGLLSCTIEDLEDLFRAHGMEPPFDL